MKCRNESIGQWFHDAGKVEAVPRRCRDGELDRERASDEASASSINDHGSLERSPKAGQVPNLLRRAADDAGRCHQGVGSSVMKRRSLPSRYFVSDVMLGLEVEPCRSLGQQRFFSLEPKNVHCETTKDRDADIVK
jgi:hypothetical protein